jgi:predicted SAM-dependent methyltransferase
MKKVLHVGCSTLTLDQAPPYFKQETWREVRYDIDPAANPDIIGTITDMHLVPTASMDAVYSSHNLEHVFPHEVIQVLKEFKRVLKSDGVCIVAVPDLHAVAKFIVENGLEDAAYTSPAGLIAPLDMLYGLRKSLTAGQYYMAHKTGFTVKTLSQYFFEVGFKQLSYKQEHYAISIIAYTDSVDQSTQSANLNLIA